MKSAQEWFDEYGESHRNPTNKAIHWVCVPLIVFSTIGLIWAIPRGPLAGVLPGALEPLLNWGTIGALFALAFYLHLSVSLFLGMLVTFGVVAAGNLAMGGLSPAAFVGVHAAIFGVSWIGQFIGHQIEGKKPSFFKDLQYLLVGPAWLLHFIYKRVGIRYSTVEATP